MDAAQTLKALLCLAAGALAGCSETPDSVADPPVRPAKLFTVAGASDVRTLGLPAVIEASATAQLAFPLPGVVAAVAVREGQRVDAGAEIARLDQRDLETELAKTEAAHRAAEADFGRVERLVADGAVPRAVFDQRATELEVARATLDGARKRLDDSVLRAPFAGVVAALNVEAHAGVGAYQAVATLQNAGAAEAIVQVPASLVAESGRLEPQDTVVVLDAAPDRPLPATFHSTAARADPAAQTFEVRFAFEPPDDLRILPGMSGMVRATVAAPGGDAAPEVPIEAVLAEGDARYVWVVDDASMTVSRREVTLGAGVGSMLPVIDGLGSGETIVAAGVSQLHDGMRVRRLAP